MSADVQRIEPKDGNVGPIAWIDEFKDLAKFVKGGDVRAPECFEDIACFHPNFVSRADRPTSRRVLPANRDTTSGTGHEVR